MEEESLFFFVNERKCTEKKVTKMEKRKTNCSFFALSRVSMERKFGAACVIYIYIKGERK